MTAATFFELLLQGGLFASVLEFSSNATSHDVGYLWRRPGLLARSLLTMYVVMPLVTLAMMALVPLPRPTEVALVLLAIAPGLPTSPKTMIGLGANQSYAISLVATSSLLTIITVPVSLAILDAVFPEQGSIHPLQVMGALSWSFLLPLPLGIALRRWAPAAAARIGGISGKIGLAMLATWWLTLLFLNRAAVLGLGLPSLGTIALWILVSFAVGHLCGGPERIDRPSLALATGLRHVGPPAIIATISFANAQPLPMILAYVTAYNTVPHLYTKWWKKRSAAGKPSEVRQPNRTGSTSGPRES